MKFDDFVDYYTGPEQVKEARVGRPAAQPKLYVPSSKAHDLGFPDDSVEGKIIQFLDQKPATMEELVEFLRSNFDEYYSRSISKEKIRQMLLDEVLDFAGEEAGPSDEEEVPELEIEPDEYEPDLQDYLPPGALADYERGQPGHF